MNILPCKKHRYGEPDRQGYVRCWDCGDTFNLAEDNDDDEDYERDYMDYGDNDGPYGLEDTEDL